MSDALSRLRRMRRSAVRRIYEQKFSARIRVTVGSATCENAAGADAVFERFRQRIAESGRKDVALSRVGCAGKCDMEPVVTVVARDQIPCKYVQMDAGRTDRVFDEHVVKGRPVREFTMLSQAQLPLPERVVSVCGGGTCLRAGALDVERAFREALRDAGLDGRVAVTRSACQGLCAQGPVAYVHPDDLVYRKLTAERVRRIVGEHFVGKRPVEAFTWKGNRLANRFFPLFGDVLFFGKQLRLTLRNCGVIDPESLDEYLAVLGYEALARVLGEMRPDDVVARILASGLRGRGGGGYPTGLKWRNTASAPGDEKFVVCNADEGDPGAFMDRSTIEGDPHTVLEGLIVAGFAVGATRGYVYIRAEYPLAIRRLERALADARRAGLLGCDILGSGWDFDVELRLGAGAFVCGEETALIHSIEGKRGQPRPRPPYPSAAGLWGKPTCINNVETLANIPVILLDGPEWFASLGTEGSKGTKVFALAGDVANTGLVEVPMGTTLRDVVYSVGGGMRDGKRFKAVQTGGPAGGCLPESALDTPVDYDTLSAAGSIMGSGGMIVMNEDACMVNVARYFIEFTQDESCGKCTPCREGTRRMLDILTRITEGRGEEGDVEKLLRLADTVKKTSLCGLGQAAPNPVISTITHFRAEYDAHVRDKRCPTAACRKLVTYTILAEACVGCGACRKNCPVACISGEAKKAHTIDAAACVRCGRCFEVCRFEAVGRN